MMITAAQAEELASEAMTHFDAAAGIYARMAEMPTWTPEYDYLNLRAQAEMAAGQAAHAAYQVWRDQQLILPCPVIGGHAYHRTGCGCDRGVTEMTPAELREFEAADAADRRDDPAMRES